jgi:hypothetical protein
MDPASQPDAEYELVQAQDAQAQAWPAWIGPDGSRRPQTPQAMTSPARTAPAPDEAAQAFACGLAQDAGQRTRPSAGTGARA